MQEPNWARVLNLLYTEETPFALPLDDEKSVELGDIGDLAISARVNLSAEEIANSADFLYEQGLIFMDHRDDEESVPDPAQNEISLTPDGFEVAHDRQMQKNQLRTNLGIGILTIFLVFGALLQGYSAYLNHDAPFDRLVLLIVAGIAGIVGIFVLYLMTGRNPRGVRISPFS